MPPGFAGLPRLVPLTLVTGGGTGFQGGNVEVVDFLGNLMGIGCFRK